MSLTSLITNGTSQTTMTARAGSSTASDGVSAAIQKLMAAKAASIAAAGGSAAASNGVTISAAAQIAAAEAADNKKDFATVTKDVRATLDAQYAADKKAGKTSSTPDLSEVSGRALAAIALDKGGDFTSAEVRAAKGELRERTREQFSATLSGSSASSAIAAYNQQLVSQYDSMSIEEREALGWTDKVRDSAASFVGTDSAPSLFDQLGDFGDSDSSDF